MPLVAAALAPLLELAANAGFVAGLILGIRVTHYFYKYVRSQFH